MNRETSLSQRPRGPSTDNSGILNERILVLVFEYLNWDIKALCQVSAVDRKLRALAKRLLWRKLCAHHAPRMIHTLTEGESNSRIIGGWHALAKLLVFCGGCQPTAHFQLSQPVSAHLAVESSRFSKTSGRSFLVKKCRGDVLYVSDPCEHARGDRQDLVGIYRGVFRGFLKSRTRDCLIRSRVEFEAEMRCPYCGARVWSMTAAKMVPRSAARRLGSSDGALEYYVCLNGHLHGTCWLVALSSSDGGVEDADG
ncbi:EID1-like F-box protein 3 [Andrographis paniculata]|uniref:EID1-like F-box protein 3 n=1 Tax=Andrographis paniculata TaxID=175694 RepID=UPI0021E7EDEE|nr:EID1-like F-box protein 3 [Andrographis paniculata]